MSMLPVHRLDTAKRMAEISVGLAKIEEALTTMPTFKRNSLWHLSRCSERHRLLLELDRLRAEARGVKL